jgi:poly-gamma-glutamate synthesis protein (capsule biosynthesis protein)
MTHSLSLAVVGDVMLGRGVNRSIGERGFADPWGDLLPIIQNVDCFLINLECALTGHNRRWRDDGGKAFYFRAPPPVVETLRLARVDFAALANNHAGDYGMPGLLDTVHVLEAAGIAHAGAGPNLAAAQAPAVLSVGPWRIGVVAFADYPAAWAATPTAPGINYTPVSLASNDFAPVEQVLAALRPLVDLVVFSIHWGPNMQVRPPEAFRAFARRVIEAGADVFWGHSAHVVQGVEIWRGKPILYDAGDFVDDYAVDARLRNDLSGLFLLRVRPPVIERIDVIPARIGRCQVNRAREAERVWFEAWFTARCAEFGTVVQAGDAGLSIRVDQPGAGGEESG